MGKFIALSYGAGTNSTAILAGMYERGLRPDVITFADTGAEKPHTYSHLTVVNNWLLSIGFPQISVVRKNYFDGRVANLYDHCIERKMLPSLAYGRKNCSQKFKIEPQNKFLNNFAPAKAVWKQGDKVVKAIGYDIDERHRAENAPAEDKKYVMWYPLIEWGWDREDCKRAIKRVGLPQPGKSACYFCPSSRYDEIRLLEQHYPELLNKALELEKKADLHTVKGLGRRFNWGQFISQPDLVGAFPADWDMPCGCFDGD
ncbi:phosphoadenosine phosphosulfate reductase [Photobacterium halotolerans]|uniref:Phosphoadenosine phosphosulfate reductase n=1 Tax=Photobacterium halotolerans TaxID=265726 RepID=A0A7X5ASQ1_9GAMM|nr:phosphoadenosine phosphosulfate reductase [Photobacterium halotolerans]NAW64531.1 phosphoadenosine phosphosulfate reductase [Photobacterium halotolerans]